MVFFVDSENGGIRNLGIFSMSNPNKQRERESEYKIQVTTDTLTSSLRPAREMPQTSQERSWHQLSSYTYTKTRFSSSHSDRPLNPVKYREEDKMAAAVSAAHLISNRLNVAQVLTAAQAELLELLGDPSVKKVSREAL